MGTSVEAITMKRGINTTMQETGQVLLRIVLSVTCFEQDLNVRSRNGTCSLSSMLVRVILRMYLARDSYGYMALEE